MKRLAAVILACLIAIPGAIFGSSNHVVRASGLRYQSVSLGSLEIVQQDSFSAYTLSADHPGHYRGMTLTDGLQLQGYVCGSAAEVKLDRKYDVLSGVAYNEDGDHSVNLSISDTSDTAHIRALFAQEMAPSGENRFHLNVHGITYLKFKSDTCSAVDLTGTLTTGSPPPSSVVLRFPTSNAGVPAGSKVLFGWQPFPHATNYAFHIWVVGLSGSASLTSTTPFSFSASIYHKTSYTWDDHGFLPGTYQYSLLPLDDQGHNLAGWSTPTQITIAS